MLLACAALAPLAQARTNSRLVGATTLQAAVDAFLVPEPPGRVRVRIAPCPADHSAQGCHYVGRGVDTVWLNPHTGGDDTETLAHEMGHVFESYMWNLHWRTRASFAPRLFRRVAPHLALPPRRGILYSTAWSERFAEAYSLCARVPELSEPYATYYWGFQTTPEDHAATCRLIEALADGYERVSGARAFGTTAGKGLSATARSR